MADHKFMSKIKHRASKRHLTQKPVKTRFPVVGIGASAGGLEAVVHLLANLPSDTGIAFVLIQHLDPTHESLSAEILSRKTPMSVKEVTDGLQVEPNNIYVIPPNHNMAILRGVLALLPRTEDRGRHMCIDFFLQSLAEDQKERAIGVILSGTASDGTAGLEAIKAQGGVTIAQDPKSAKYDGMPRSAIASGTVDLVLPPSEIAKELVRIARHPLLARYNETPADTSEEPATSEQDGLTKIFILLRKHCHVDFSHYKHTTVRRRIARRMVLQKKDSLADYGDYLQANSAEVKALFDDILINVTGFFRDSESFNELKGRVFPEIMTGRASDAPIRVWTVGCSTGQETYSLAMSLLEFLGDAASRTPIQIFATDISESAIQKARAGIYPDDISQIVSKGRLQRFFVKIDGGYKINKSVREMCLFSRHDVTSDPPFARIDLICCRNLLIYFDSVLQKRVFKIFHYALNPGGFLWLGRSESAGQLSTLFTVADKTSKIYVRKNTPQSTRLQFAVSSYTPETRKPPDKVAEPITDNVDVQRETDRIALSEYVPPGVVIDHDMQIVLSRGDTSLYLTLPPGQVSFNLFKMARAELVSDLRMTIQAAKKQNRPVGRTGLRIQRGERLETFGIKVIPFKTSPHAKEHHFLIFFEPAVESGQSAPLGKRHKKQSARQTEAENRQIKELQRQLAEAKAYQQTLAEDAETTQEEITSANEELQSTNEEFQSTNEELETAKEELQSANEELNTLNDELQSRNNDLTVVNDDLINLLGSVDVPVVMVGLDGRIRRFTANAGRVMNLIPSDVGRSIGDIRPSFEVPDLYHLVSTVIDTITVKELEVQDRAGHWFRFQIRPYKTADNRIDGAVITLVDIDFLKQHLSESTVRLDYAISIANTVTQPLAVLDSQLRLTSANHAFFDVFRVAPKESGKAFLSVLSGGAWPDTPLRKMLSDVLSSNIAMTNFEISHEFPKIGHRTLLVSARRIQWVGLKSDAILVSMDDITERRKSEENIVSLSRFFEENPSPVMRIRRDGTIVVANRATERLLPQFVRDTKVSGEWTTWIEDALRSGASKEVEIQVGGSMYLMFIAPVVSDGYVNVFGHDITARKRLEMDLRAAIETRDDFLSIASHELKTPLTALHLQLQLMGRIVRKEMAGSRIESLSSGTLQASKQIVKLLDELLDITRIRAGKLILDRQEVDLKAAVIEGVSAVSEEAQQKGIVVTVKADQPVVGKWDPSRITQIISNLLSNALKYGNGNIIEVTVSVDHETAHAKLLVRDQGMGVPREMQSKIFERFERGAVPGNKITGLGLGLYIVRQIVEAHGGSIRVESEPGKGSLFIVELPLRQDTRSDNQYT